MDLAIVFEFVNDVANDTAATVCGDRGVEVNRAMRTVRARKLSVYRTFEGLRTFLAKWRNDPDELCPTAIAQVFAGSDVFTANRACCRIQQRYGCLEQLRFLKRHYLLTRVA